MKKTTAVLFSMFLVGALFFHAADAAFKTFTSGENQDVPLEVKSPADTEPNVLFYLDVSANMGVSMTGLKPVTPETDPQAYTTYPSMEDANNRMDMIRNDTFGLGVRVMGASTHDAQKARLADTTLPFRAPIDIGPGGDGNGNHTRYGRDIDASNNIIGDPNCYYSLDPTRPYLLTFRPQALAKWDGRGKVPTVTGTYVTNMHKLTPYLPGGSLAGQPVPLDLAKEYLVPNDSKMYKLKLVLSQILKDDPDNMKMLSRMRLGVATSFYELYRSGSGGSLSPLKRDPFRTRPGESTTWYRKDYEGEDLYLLRHKPDNTRTGENYQRYPLYRIGENTGKPVDTPTGYGWFAVSSDIGIAFQGSDIYLQTNTARIGDDVTVASLGGVFGYSDPAYKNRDKTHYKRSIMHVPFDFMYTRSGDVYAPSSSLITFREHIDGIELYQDGNGDPKKTFPNNEFFISQAPGSAEELIYNTPNFTRWSVYPTGATDNIGQVLDPHPYSEANLSARHKRLKNSEGLMTGTVTGTILDFFDPAPATTVNKIKYKDGKPENTDFNSGVTWSDTGEASDTRGYFPVTNSCQDNWVIYFTTGNEVNPGVEPKEGEISMINSFLGIARDSLTIRGRTRNPATGEWKELEHTMDNPVRIVVVGLISTEGMRDDPDPYTSPNDSRPLVRARNAMRRMAHAGQPTFTRNANGSINPTSLKPNRTKNTNGQYVVQPLFADNVPELIAGLNAILGNIRKGRTAGGAPRLQQTEVDASGNLVYFASSYETDNNKQWQSSFSRYSIPKGQQYASRVWEAGQNMVSDDRTDKVYVHINGSEAVTLNSAGNDFLSAVGFNNSDFGAPEGELFKKWLTDYKSKATVDGKEVDVDDNGILGSMEHSAPMFAPKADPKNNIFPKTIFMQTNRGVLHALDYEKGTENWAFIPPPILENRLWRQKFTQLNPEDLSVVPKSYMKGEGDRMPSSQQMMLLDGGISLNETGGGKYYLVGALGLSGNGLYVMDVTEDASATGAQKPKFVWAIDNDRYETPQSNSVNWWGMANISYNNIVGWEDLGLTIVAPELRRTNDTQNEYVGIVPGGLGWNLGWKDDKIDTQGRALYVFDHLNGSIIKKITQKNTSPGGDITMGMGINPVYYITMEPGDSGGPWRTKEFFTSDSEGDILFCDTRGNVSDWELRSIFRVTTTDNNKEGLVMPNAYALVRFSNNSRWLFGGTADLLAPETETVTEGESQKIRQRGIRNREQYIFGLTLSKMGLNDPSFTTYGMGDLTPLKYLPEKGQGENQQAIGEGSFTGQDKGWYLKLADPDPNATPSRGGEYISAAPYFNEIDGLLYVGTFTEYTSQAQQADCESIGFAKLYSIDPTTGKSGWDGGTTQALTFENMKIMGITSVSRIVDRKQVNSLILATSSQDGNESATKNGAEVLDEDGDVVFNLPDNRGSLPNIPEDIPNLQYWREMF